MPTLTIEYATEAERLQIEAWAAYVREANALGLAAPRGTVLDACETFALDRGRALLRDTLQATAQARADAEKKCPARGRRGGTPGA